MIDEARALLERVEGRTALLEAELRQLGELRASLLAFIEQPGQAEASGEAPAGVGSPVPASTPAAGQGVPPTSPPPATSNGCPECSADIKPQGLGTHRRLKHGVVPTPAAAAPELRECPECGDEVKAIGLGTHRRLKHGRRTTHAPPSPAWSPAPVPATPPATGSKATWLCPRCPQRFRSDEERQAHYDATGHGSAAPLPGRPAGFGQ